MLRKQSFDSVRFLHIYIAFGDSQSPQLLFFKLPLVPVTPRRGTFKDSRFPMGIPRRREFNFILHLGTGDSQRKIGASQRTSSSTSFLPVATIILHCLEDEA